MDILKKIRLIFQNFPRTVINDLNKLHQSPLGVKGGGGKTSPLNSPLSNI